MEMLKINLYVNNMCVFFSLFIEGFYKKVGGGDHLSDHGEYIVIYSLRQVT